MVGLAKQCTRRLLLASRLPDNYWSYAMRFAAEMLRHKALGFSWNMPAFGEEVGMWRSQDKKLIKSANNRGAIGRLMNFDRSYSVAEWHDFFDCKGKRLARSGDHSRTPT